MQHVWMRLLFLALIISATLPASASAEESAGELSVQAQKECDLGRRAIEREVRLAHFEKSQALAERSVALNDDLANAHFALFCSLGEQLRIDGESFYSVFGFRRALRELDRTLELDPNHLDALSSKGTFLIRLPALLGGDAAKGEQLLKRVIERAPKAVNARLTLAKVYARRGNRADAIVLATQALQIAQAERRADLLPEAQATLAELQPTPSVAVMLRP